MPCSNLMAYGIHPRCNNNIGSEDAHHFDVEKDSVIYEGGNNDDEEHLAGYVSDTDYATEFQTDTEGYVSTSEAGEGCGSLVYDSDSDDTATPTNTAPRPDLLQPDNLSPPENRVLVSVNVIDRKTTMSIIEGGGSQIPLNPIILNLSTRIEPTTAALKKVLKNNHIRLEDVLLPDIKDKNWNQNPPTYWVRSLNSKRFKRRLTRFSKRTQALLRIIEQENTSTEDPDARPKISGRRLRRQLSNLVTNKSTAIMILVVGRKAESKACKDGKTIAKTLGEALRYRNAAATDTRVPNYRLHQNLEDLKPNPSVSFTEGQGIEALFSNLDLSSSGNCRRYFHDNGEVLRKYSERQL
ncbi:hypothetical protein TWF281_002498 [Arthrobotrys megalospora]